MKFNEIPKNGFKNECYGNFAVSHTACDAHNTVRNALPRIVTLEVVLLSE